MKTSQFLTYFTTEYTEHSEKFENTTLSTHSSNSSSSVFSVCSVVNKKTLGIEMKTYSCIQVLMWLVWLGFSCAVLSDPADAGEELSLSGVFAFYREYGAYTDSEEYEALMLKCQIAMYLRTAVFAECRQGCRHIRIHQLQLTET